MTDNEPNIERPADAQRRHALAMLLGQLEQDATLLQPDRLRQRSDALNRLELLLLSDADHAHDPGLAALQQRAASLCAALEATDVALYQALRERIRRGFGADALREIARHARHVATADTAADSGSYDCLDEMLGGILQLQPPADSIAPLAPDMVFYQPTPARHIFELIERCALGADDVLVDLGAGLGHVPLLAGICSRARCVGIEYQATYVEQARRSAAALALSRVGFVHRDARDADFSDGTVFYLYTPFGRAILRQVLDRLRHEAQRRVIRIGSYGPCTVTLAAESWLAPEGEPRTDRITLFRSHH